MYKNVLLIDESAGLGRACKSILNGQADYADIADPHLARELLAKKEIDVVVLSSSASDTSALASLQKLHVHFPDPSCILAAQDPTIEFIVSAFRCGISEVVRKPADPVTLASSFFRISGAAGTDNAAASFKIYRLLTFPPDLCDGCAAGEVSTSTPILSRSTVASRIFSRAKEVLQRTFKHHKESAETQPELHQEVVPELPASATAEKTSSHIELATSTECRQQLRVMFFGRFRLEVNGHVIDKCQSRKARLLFAYMLLNRKRLFPRDVLMERFWPHSEQECSRNSLNVALHEIRQALRLYDPDNEYIFFKDDCYLLNGDLNIYVDAEEFLNHWQKSRVGEAKKNAPGAIVELELARALYAGNFMEEDLYDDWAATERDNFREIYLAILDRLSENYVHTERFSSAAALCEDVLSKDNCREDIHRRLMLSYYRAGCRDKALRQFKKCTDALKEELEVEPTKLTRQLYEEIKAERLTSQTYF